MGETAWTLDKRYSNFDSLHQSLRSKYAIDASSFPGKSYWKLKGQALETRWMHLEQYMRVSLSDMQRIAERQDIKSDPFFWDFLELDLHNSQTLVFAPIKVAEIEQLGVRDFVYVKDKGWLFLALSDMNIASWLDSYLTNAQLPWEKKSDTEVTYSTVGALLFYQVGMTKNMGQEEWKFQRLWAINYPSQTNSIIYVAEHGAVIVGLGSGKIHTYWVTESGWQLDEVSSLWFARCQLLSTHWLDKLLLVWRFILRESWACHSM